MKLFSLDNIKKLLEEKRKNEMAIGIIGNITTKKILSVEKGNVDKPGVTGQRVVAFTLDGDNDVKIKILLKDKIAVTVYNMFLKDTKTKHATIDHDGVIVDKEVYVSFTEADIREVRANKEIVCQNPKNLQFTFDYLVLG
jgi:hypothetical protein